MMNEQTVRARPSYASPMREGRWMANVKTQGEIEAAVCNIISHFLQDRMGCGPRDIHAYLLRDLLVVRLTAVLTVAEQHLAQSLPSEKGRDLLKQVRAQLIEAARPFLEEMIHKATGVRVLSLHRDISTVSGEEIIAFTLAEAPYCRVPQRR